MIQDVPKNVLIDAYYAGHPNLYPSFEEISNK